MTSIRLRPSVSKACISAYATFHTESQRHYPSGETAAHVLGGLGVIRKKGRRCRACRYRARSG